MTTTAIIAIIAAIVFVLYCFMAEADCSAKHSPAIVTILCRLVARHIKLDFKLLVGLMYFIVGMACIFGMQEKPHVGTGSGGPETERLTGFINRVTCPVQLVVDGFIGFLGLIAIGICIGLVSLKESVVQHRLFYIGAIIVTYLVWLVLNICEIVEEEVVSVWTYTESENPGDPRPVPHRFLTKQDHAAWSVLTFVLWIVLAGTSIACLSSRITYAPASPLSSEQTYAAPEYVSGQSLNHIDFPRSVKTQFFIKTGKP